VSSFHDADLRHHGITAAAAQHQDFDSGFAIRAAPIPSSAGR
jgi:hypothetical protein